MSSTRVLVLAGGLSHERDISLRSGRRVAEALRGHGFSVDVADVDTTLLERLHDDRPDVVWPLLHGAAGEDGALFALLELARVPAVGSPSTAARLAWDKPTAKTVVERFGLSVPAALTLPQASVKAIGASELVRLVTERMPQPLVVKPARGGSAQGVTITEDSSSLPRALVDAFTYCESILIEQRIRGIEVAVGVVDTGEGPLVLPPVEIEPLRGSYDFEARYTAGSTRFYAPARLTQNSAERIARDALTAHRALGLGALSRIDFIVDEHGVPWFLEANVVPGMTETSLVPIALEAAGHDLGWAYAGLVRSALPSASG